MHDEPNDLERERGDEQEHPLESPDSLREPRDEDGEEQERVPRPGVMPDLDDRQRA
jgi:hypothetical protein